MRLWYYSREWVWNLRTKLCCIVSRKWNVSGVSFQELYINYIMFWDIFDEHVLVTKRWISLTSIQVIYDWFPVRGNMYLLFNCDIVNFLLKINGGKGNRRNRRHSFVIFVVWSTLIVSEWVAAGGVEQKILFRTAVSAPKL